MAERNVHFKGMSDLSKFMEQLAPRMEANVMRAALSAGARIVRNAAAANCPVAPPSRTNEKMYGGYPSALRDSIRHGSSIKQSKGKVIAYVRAGGHARGKPADTYYAKFVEYGTMPHNNGHFMHPGAMPRPFMRPALDVESEHALAVIANFIKNRLETKHGLDTSAVVLGENT